MQGYRLVDEGCEGDSKINNIFSDIPKRRENLDVTMDIQKKLLNFFFGLVSLWRCTIFFIVTQTSNKTKKQKTWACISILPPPKSILCRATFCSNYSCKSLGVCLYKLGTSSHWDFCPFFKAKLLQLLQVGCVPLVYSNL